MNKYINYINNFKQNELSKQMLEKLLKVNKIEIALCKYIDNPNSGVYNVVSDSAFFRDIDEYQGFLTSYFMALEEDCDDVIDECFNIYESNIKLDQKNTSYNLGGNEFIFLERLGKSPFYVNKKRFGAYENNIGFIDVIKTFGVGVFCEPLAEWLKGNTFNDYEFEGDDKDIYEYVEELYEQITDEYQDGYYTPSISNIEHVDINSLDAKRLEFLLGYRGGFEFNLVSIGSKDIDNYIEKFKNYPSKLDELLEEIEKFYSFIIPSSHTTALSKVLIIDESNPIFKLNNIYGCKYSLTYFAVCEEDWEFSNENCQVDGNIARDLDECLKDFCKFMDGKK